jgi:hypothetical protein
MNHLACAILTAVVLLVASPIDAEGQRARHSPSAVGSTNAPALRAFVRSGDWLSGFADSSGKVVIEPRFSFASGFADGRALIRSGDAFGYIDARGRLVVPAQFRCADAFSEGLARVTVASGEYGYIDPAGTFVIPARRRHPSDVYARDLSFHDGLALFWESGKWGFVDRRGRVAIPPVFESASRFSQGLAMVRFAGEAGVGFVDRTGKPAFAARFAAARDFSEGLAVVAMYFDDELRYGYVDRSGAYVTELEFTEAGDLRGGLALVVKGPRVSTFRNLRESACVPREGPLAGVPGGTYYGPGELPPPGKAGYVDATGKLAIPLRFEGAGEFSEGLAPFEQGRLWGFVDTRGEVVIPPRFAFVAEGFTSGIATVALPGASFGYERRIYINTSGREVLAQAPAK